jgi:2-polyprenyl-3-methyl-5-hydroxy-6-metoxy-1,4-benzoquinol methylase
LPKPPASILDIGGGPGRYSVALAQQGYTVTLFDLSQSNLAFARMKAQEAGVTLAGYVRGSAVDLSTCASECASESGSECFDVVLLMGPLYHLLTETERHVALREARRVLKTGGIIAAAFITRYAPIRDAAKRNPAWAVNCESQLGALLETGVLVNTTGFTDAYFAHPVEVRPLLESHGFETLDLIATEGVVAWIEEALNGTSDDAVWEAWVRLNYRLGKDPSVHGAAAHLLYVGRKGQTP